MNFHEELRKQREAMKLSPEQAAEKLHLSVRGYQDCEDNRADMNVPYRCGLLVGLGMIHDQALGIATRLDTFSFGSPEMQARMQQDVDDPFVRETDDAFILVARDHDNFEYTVPKDNVQTAENILGWVEHLGEKVWVTRDHLGLFVALTSHYLGLKIHPVT